MNPTCIKRLKPQNDTQETWCGDDIKEEFGKEYFMDIDHALADHNITVCHRCSIMAGYELSKKALEGLKNKQ